MVIGIMKSKRREGKRNPGKDLKASSPHPSQAPVSQMC
jgi:hypothetical protein